MTTFSQLVDSVTLQMSRPDLVSLTAGQLNLTIRQLFNTDRGTPVYYSAAMVEEQVTAASDTSLTWTPSTPYLFQILRTARYDSVYNQENQQIYPTEAAPGRIMNQHKHYYYRSGDTFVFEGFGGIGATVTLAWHRYLPSLKYYAAGPTRPAEFDAVTGWTYQAPYAADSPPNDQALAQTLTSNWMLQRWGTVVEEGLRAKLYKLQNDERARTSYALYQELREGLYRAESTDSLRG